MSGTKCPICNRAFRRTDKVVRVVAEIVERGPDDGKDVDHFSKVLDWDSFATMHLSCARMCVEEGREMPYGEEVAELPIFEKELGDPSPPSMLKLVHG